LRRIAIEVDDGNDVGVIHLREWASDRIHYLPHPPVRPYQGEWFIGTDPSCVIRLADPRISRRHARPLHEDSRWGLLDVGSRNGTRIDGNRQAIGFLGSGAEVTLGGLTLIAESARLLELRDFLCRWLGWANERAATVDLALRAVRLAQVRRTPLVLHGAGDLVPIARELHRLVFEAGAPFVLCDALGPSIAANIREAKVFCRQRSVRQPTLAVAERQDERVDDGAGAVDLVRSERDAADRGVAAAAEALTEFADMVRAERAEPGIVARRDAHGGGAGNRGDDVLARGEQQIAEQARGPATGNGEQVDGDHFAGAHRDIA
jgi:Inner membrane component of T3SS, cytoplasmic domain